MGGILGFLYRQLTFKPKPLPSTISLAGSTALITGANIGLGFEAARELACHKLSRLILAVRDTSKGETAKTTISKESPGCDVHVWQLDYDSYDSIVAFGAKVATLDRLDYVLLNAGLKQVTYTASHTGHETNVQINHIGTSLLSLLILPTLQKTAKETGKPSRMTIVSSEGHFWTPFKERSAPNILARLDEEETFGRVMQRYYTSKLLNVFWTRELASRIDKSEVVINTPNPGWCYSGLHRYQMTSLYDLVLRMLSWTSAEGGHCLVDALVLHEESHGQYLSEQKETPFVVSTEGEKVQKQIWSETLDLLKRE
ncbi:short-chain dehydrogenase/reductase SDR, partial [Lophium mytilinum]